MTRRIRLALLPVTAAVLVTSCLDGPLARTNPYDPHTVRSVTLVALTDTVRRVGEHAAFQLVVDPPVVGIIDDWSTDRPDLFAEQAGGRFQLISLPAAPTVVTMTAGWANRRASAQVVVVPE